MSRAAPPPADPVFYPVKWVLDGRDASLPVCMQARNGPCALLALANLHLQSRAFSLTQGTTRIREDHLMHILADFVSTRPPSGSATAEKLREHAVADFLDVLPRLAAGLHVNVRFTAPSAFEFTRELAVFDVFPDARLLHGWLVDPQDTRLAEALAGLSYNQLVDELVRTASPPPPLPPEPLAPEPTYDALAHAPSAPPIEAFDLFAHDHPDDASDGPYANEAPPDPPAPEPMPPPTEQEPPHTRRIREIRPFVMDFLESNPTQLTVYGLTELHAAIAEGGRAILFRNSHFYVVHKHQSELFTLVTDEGYLNELNTVWEKLADINGDSTFYNGKFQRISPTGEVVGAASSERPAEAAAAAPAPGPARSSPSLGRYPSQTPPVGVGVGAWGRTPPPAQQAPHGQTSVPTAAQRPVQASGRLARRSADKCVVQ